MERVVTYNSKRSGFTLAEVLIVMGIVVILAGVSVPIFASIYRKNQIKHVKDQETAAKAAAVAAFYTGYDSKGNVVDITQTGVCTFLYDAENNAVYVLNSNAGVQDFANNGYSSSIDMYGLNIPQGDNHTRDVILIKFDGRYLKYNKNTDAPNYSKGTFEEPLLTLEWAKAPALIIQKDSEDD